MRLSQRRQLLSKYVARPCYKGNGKNLANAGSGDHYHFPTDQPKSLMETFQMKFVAFCEFARLYSFVGRGLSIVSSSFLGIEKLSDISLLFLSGVLKAIVATFFVQLYINSINQLEDIEIDKINKPYLPLASGEYSIETVRIITASSALMSFWLAWMVGSWPLFSAILVIFVFGTIYSINLPFLRWKRSAFLAALCVFAMGVPTELAFYLHTQTFVFGRPAYFPKRVIFTLAFMSIFTVVAAIFKDIPDVDGDKIHGVRSFAVQFGKEKVFSICFVLFQIIYVVAILVGLTSSQKWSKFITVASHICLALIHWSRAKSVDLGNKTSVTSFYMFIWKLLYAESFLVPLIR
ncbi:OLC1v1005344C2 [Oldenlandia corymbosa var. corymbosa]|nr:OLC1v1005344C2 [Oldenlandia corymbosa var. corymbosa]